MPLFSLLPPKTPKTKRSICKPAKAGIFRHKPAFRIKTATDQGASETPDGDLDKDGQGRIDDLSADRAVSAHEPAIP